MLIKICIFFIIMFILINGCSGEKSINKLEREYDDSNTAEYFYAFDNVNVRKAPGIEEEVIYEFYHNEKVKVIDRKDKQIDGFEWWEVEVHGDGKGWVASEYISKKELPKKNELFKMIPEAERLVVNRFVKAFYKYNFEGEKIFFNELKSDLKNYYADEEIKNLEDIYKNYLFEIGYGVGDFFPFHDYDNIENLLESIEINNKIKIKVRYPIDKLPAGAKLEKQEDEIIYYIKDMKIVRRDPVIN